MSQVFGFFSLLLFSAALVSCFNLLASQLDHQYATEGGRVWGFFSFVFFLVALNLSVTFFLLRHVKEMPSNCFEGGKVITLNVNEDLLNV